MENKVVVLANDFSLILIEFDFCVLFYFDCISFSLILCFILNECGIALINLNYLHCEIVTAVLLQTKMYYFLVNIVNQNFSNRTFVFHVTRILVRIDFVFCTYCNRNFSTRNV